MFSDVYSLRGRCSLDYLNGIDSPIGGVGPPPSAYLFKPFSPTSTIASDPDAN
jgi:hypothetical protein